MGLSCRLLSRFLLSSRHGSFDLSYSFFITEDTESTEGMR